MKDISFKLRHIYLRYILISIGFIVLYSTTRWYLDYELGVLHVKEDLLNFWLPFVLPLIPIAIWLRRGIMCLSLRGKRDNGFFAFQFIAAMTIFVPTLITQEYIEASSSNLIEIQSITEIKSARMTDCFKIKDFNVIKEYAGAHQSSRTSGRNNEDLYFTNYFVVPLVDASIHLDTYSHKYWYGFKFKEEMSNYASDDKKNERWNSFYQECVRDYEKYDFEKFVYLQGLSYSDDRDGYIKAIKARQKNVNTEELIILEPIDKPFEAKRGNKFGWIFGSFGIGSFVFLVMIIIPEINKTELKRYLDRKPLKEDDLKDMLNFLVPKGEHFTTAVLVDVNLIIFILQVASGINIMSATPNELLEIGANRRYEVMNGESWRLFTSMFLHGGLMHIFMNLIGIGVTCSLTEPILGRYKTLFAYLVSGVGASLASIYWHENTVSVGASGAIFGMMGVMTALLVTKKDCGFKGVYYFILSLYGGVSLLFGFLGGIDNAAHIGGLLTGFLVGLLILVDWKKLTQANRSGPGLLMIAFLMLAINSQCKRSENNTVKDIDGNIYNTVLFGDYWWMTENLKSTRFNDGSDIPCVKDQSIWLGLDSSAYCYYRNNLSYADTLGFLYNWYAVNSGKLCPTGWRVPSDSDWINIEGTADTKYNINDSIWNKPGLRGFDAGQRLKSVTGWREGVTGTDDIGFSALPGGERLSRFYAWGSTGFWWTSTEASASSAYYRSLIYSYEQVARDTHPKRMGFSVRCIKNK